MVTISSMVLIVSRDQGLLARLAEQCRRERLGAVGAGSLPEASFVVRGNGADVVVIDLALPDEHGFEVVRRLRQESEVPLMLLSEDGGAEDEEVGLSLGADDYVPRSEPPRLIVARVKALLRRTRRAPRPKLLRAGPLQLDGRRLRASVDGTDVALTLAELRLLEALLRASGAVLTRRRLLEASGSEPCASERTVDVHVANIRRKLTPFGLADLLQTVRGVGYRLAWQAGRGAAARGGTRRGTEAPSPNTVDLRGGGLGMMRCASVGVGEACGGAACGSRVGGGVGAGVPAGTGG